MSQKRIIICGYPKSGNTWLTRLTAEIVGCPVAGFWCQPFNKDISIEGQDRKSEYICFKSHHNAEDMEWTFQLYGNQTEKIIYVVRDPRDVIISAIHYFKIEPQDEYLFKVVDLAPAIIKKIYRKYYLNERYKINYMVNAIVAGSDFSKWLNTPWNEHVSAYVNRNGLFVKYEDLLSEPVKELYRILNYLGISRSSKEIGDAVEKQSFEYKKRKLLEEKKFDKAWHLRRGTTRQWVGLLTENQINEIKNNAGVLMNKLGYTI